MDVLPPQDPRWPALSPSLNTTSRHNTTHTLTLLHVIEKCRLAQWRTALTENNMTVTLWLLNRFVPRQRPLLHDCREERPHWREAVPMLRYHGNACT